MGFHSLRSNIWAPLSNLVNVLPVIMVARRNAKRALSGLWLWSLSVLVSLDMMIIVRFDRSQRVEDQRGLRRGLSSLAVARGTLPITTGEAAPCIQVQTPITLGLMPHELLVLSHADDQRRLQEHEVQLQLLEREVGEAQQSQTDLVGQEEIQQLREKKEEQEEQIQTLEKIFSDIESEIQGSDDRLTLAQQIRQLVESEARLAREVDEHEKKEVAFRETLSEADVIMSSIEQGYHSRVSELEESRRMLEARLQVQEAAQERLQQALRGKPDAGQISQLLESLTNLEKVELGLREKISSLERSERELGVRLLAEQKTINNLKEELKEQEEVAVRAMEQEVEVSRLEAEVQRLREFEFRHGELAQSEEFLRGRVEELEGAEQTLRDNMAVVGQAAALRERRLEERLARMSEELEQQSSSVTSFEDACIVLRGEEEGLRQEIVALRGEIEEGCKREAKSAEAEEELRSELVKARATLERTNSQLAQLDSDNCTLRVRVSQGEEEVRKKAFLIMWNNLLSRRLSLILKY